MPFEFRCPIENASAAAAGLLPRRLNELLHESLAFHRLLHQHARLDNHRLAMIFLLQAVDVIDGLLQRLVLAAGQLGLHVPVGIDAQSYHVPMGTILAKSVEDKVIALGITAAVEMNDAHRIGIDALHRLIASLRQSRILLHILLGTAHRPQEAMGGLVAHLHPPHINAVVFQQLQRLTGMLGQRIFHLVVFEILPGGRNMLFARVSPPVAIVEVDHHIHIVVAGTLRHIEHVVHVAEAATRIHPHAQPHRIQPQLLHQGRVLANLPLLVV